MSMTETEKVTPLKETPSQTAGPYIHIGMDPDAAGLAPFFDKPPFAQLAGPAAKGRRIKVEGNIYDGDGALVKDAIVEVWQADASGIYNSSEDPRYAERDPGVIGWSRSTCDLQSGVFHIDTIKPGPVPGPGNSLMAPHLNLWIVARGINIGLATRIYFPDEADANESDPILALVEDPARRATLIAGDKGGDAETALYRFDIHLQGDNETVFFDI